MEMETLRLNVSPEADLEFMRLLEKEDETRYQKFTAQTRFETPQRFVAGIDAVVSEKCSFCGAGLTFIRYTIKNYDGARCSADCMCRGTFGTAAYDLIRTRYKNQTEQAASPRKSGRPKLRLSEAARIAHRREQVREAVRACREKESVIKNTPIAA